MGCNPRRLRPSTTRHARASATGSRPACLPVLGAGRQGARGRDSGSLLSCRRLGRGRRRRLLGRCCGRLLGRLLGRRGLLGLGRRRSLGRRGRGRLLRRLLGRLLLGGGLGLRGLRLGRVLL